MEENTTLNEEQITSIKNTDLVIRKTINTAVEQTEKALNDNEIADKIQILLQSNQKNYYSIGKYLSIVKSRLTKKEYIKFLQDERIGVQYSQSITIIGFYEYISVQEKKGRTTDQFYKIGIEKTYILSTLEDKEQQADFEELINNYNPSVKILKKIKSLLNENYKQLRNNEIKEDKKLNVEDAYELARTEKKEVKQNKEQEEQLCIEKNLDKENERLKIENEELKAENKKYLEKINELELELKKFKNQEISHESERKSIYDNSEFAKALLF